MRHRPPTRAAIRAVALGAWLALAACGTTAADAPAGAEGLASAQLALDAQALPSGLVEVELRLSRGDAEPRVARARVRGVGVLLRLTGLTPGTWLAAVEGFDADGATLVCGFAAVDLPAGAAQSLRVPTVEAARCEARELDCENGGDDDVDGATDCDDPDCEELVCGPGVDCGPPATCVRGACVPGGPGDCDDGDPCTDDSCSPGGRCAHEPTTCDDGDACTVGTCDSVRGCRFSPVDCDDADACTTDSCSAASGCRHASVSCDDADLCTDDDCDPIRGCVATPVHCDDGDPCTLDACDPASGCVSEPDSCDDADPCTLDACDPATGCVHEPNPDCEGDCSVAPAGSPCDDGDPCTTDDVCEADACVGGAPTCDDGNGCTTDLCDAGSCSYTAIPEGELCDDGDPCWTGGVCTFGICLPGTTPLDCDDGDPCTIDTCDRGVGCRHDACPAGYQCAAGACVAMAPPSGAQLRHVPGGPFWMGCTLSEDTPFCQAYSNASPHGVTLSPFDVMTTEATVQQLIDCRDAGGCVGVTFCAPSTPTTNYPDHPATCLNRAEAESFCSWAGLRLCTEAEWEKAARGPDARTYPWGNTQPDCTVAVFNEAGAGGQQGCGTATVAEVGSRPAGRSPYGALDMIGNAAEWVADGYDATYYRTGPTTDPQGPETATLGVTRGGEYSDVLTNPQFLFSWYRVPVDPTTGPFSVGHYGVRCCRDAAP